MSDLRATLAETLAAHQPTQLGDSCRCGVGWTQTTIAAHQADVLLGLSGVAVVNMPNAGGDPSAARHLGLQLLAEATAAEIGQ